jgi:hypothetical protein
LYELTGVDRIEERPSNVCETHMLKVALDIGDPIVDKIMYDVVGMDETCRSPCVAMVITCFVRV